MTWLWKPQSLTGQLYLAIEQAGESGFTRAKAVAKFSAEFSVSQIDVRMAHLRKKGFLKIRSEADTPTVHFINEAHQRPIFEGEEVQACVRMVREFPGGVSHELACEELGISPIVAARLLRKAADEGLIRRHKMPANHGGGAGWIAQEACNA